MTEFVPRALATGVGSLPHPDPRTAIDLVLKTFPTIPFWPQLPRRDFRENMYAQYSDHLPSVQLDLPHEWMGAVIGDDKLAQVEEFYVRYLTDDLELFAMSADYAAGLYALRDSASALRDTVMLKGQVTGPISFGLKVVDQTLKPMLYDEALRDVLVKHLARKAQWQEKFLQSVLQPCEGSRFAPSQSCDTIIFIDEPSLALVGASLVALNREEVVRDLEEVFSALQGLKGTHCCGNTDWGMLLDTSVNVISFDAYTYAENLALFADEVKHFLHRDGILAWGIVPTIAEHIARETAESLVARLDAAIALLVKKGIDRDTLYARALITPACGLGTISESAAERALELTRQVSARVREREWKLVESLNR
ncbi:MAG: methionine synthase [Chloroflexi bacterium]|nr:methionine synthase [Chloroflexota bacterium]